MAPKASTTTTTGADPRTIHFDPLDETNYHYWAMRMEAELIRRDLWSVIVCDEDDLVGKTDEEVNAARVQWLNKRTAKKMAEARSEIVARVCDSQLDHFLMLKDPKVIWETLAGIHVARGLATRLALRRKFLRLVKDEGEDYVGLGWQSQADGISTGGDWRGGLGRGPYIGAYEWIGRHV